MNSPNYLIENGAKINTGNKANELVSDLATEEVKAYLESLK